MDSPAGERPPTELLAHTSSAFQWATILLGSALLFIGLEAMGLPAAALIGPMLVGVVAGVNGATVRVPKPLFAGAQAIIGILIARSIEPEMLAAFADDWPPFLLGVVSTVAASSFLGWQISRWKILPGSTAVWGSAPGAATAMVLMAGAFGADARLVAFMQYLRVLMVAGVAAAIAALIGGEADVAPEPVVWFPPFEPLAFATVAGVAALGAAGGWLLRLPSPFVLGAMTLGAALHLGGGVDFQLPHWLLAASYALIGWTIGLNFTRTIVRHAARALPQVLGSIVALMLFCAGMALVLSHWLGVDILTAYLATSPGGMDSVAIIAAASSSVNMSFVMAMQLGRFLVVLLLGPSIARLIAGRMRV